MPGVHVDDPAAAMRDLETAWEALDAILGSLLDGQELLGSTAATLALAPTATPASWCANRNEVWTELELSSGWL